MTDEPCLPGSVNAMSRQHPAFLRLTWLIFVVAIACASRTPIVEEPDRTARCRALAKPILDAMEVSRETTCSSDDEWTIVTSPLSPIEAYHVVVHVSDRDALERRSLEHLEACGAFIHHEAIDAFRVVEARCVDGRCRAEETIFHVDGE